MWGKILPKLHRLLNRATSLKKTSILYISNVAKYQYYVVLN